MQILSIFIVGLAILVGALLLNVIANSLSIPTWYTALKEPSQWTLLSALWLMMLYPFLLGLVAYGISKLIGLS